MLLGEAKRLLAIDGRRFAKRFESGKAGPERVGPQALFTIARRVLRAAPDGATRVLVERAIRTKAQGARTHSEVYGMKLSILLTTTIGRFDPDVQRGILYYVCGNDQQHGLAIMALTTIGESSGVEVTAKLVAWRKGILDALRQQDEAVLAEAQKLPLQVRRLVKGALYEAQTAMAEKDERTARSWLIQVRRLVARFRGRNRTAGGRRQIGGGG